MRFHYVAQDSLKCLRPLTPEHWNWRQVLPRPASMEFLFQKSTAFSFPKCTQFPLQLLHQLLSWIQRKSLSVTPACRGEHLVSFCKTQRLGPSPVLSFSSWTPCSVERQVRWNNMVPLAQLIYPKAFGKDRSFPWVQQKRSQEARGREVGRGTMSVHDSALGPQAAQPLCCDNGASSISWGTRLLVSILLTLKGSLRFSSKWCNSLEAKFSSIKKAHLH